MRWPTAAGRLAPAALIGLFTAGVNQALLHAAHIPASWATFGASVVLGYGCAFWSRRSPYPVSLLALMSVTGAIIPGLTVYVGVAETVFGDSGTGAFSQAVLTGTGIGVGVAAGVLLATGRPEPARLSASSVCGPLIRRRTTSTGGESRAARAAWPRWSRSGDRVPGSG